MVTDRRHAIRRVLELRRLRRWLAKRFEQLREDIGADPVEAASFGWRASAGLSDDEPSLRRKSRALPLVNIDGPAPRHAPVRGMTLEEVGAVLGCSRERVRQIERNALRKLRHPKRLKFFDITLAPVRARLA